MKSLVVILCVAVFSSAFSGPVKHFIKRPPLSLILTEAARTSALDLLEQLEKIVEDEGHDLITKVVHVIHKVEDGVVSLKGLIPKVYQKIHDEADEILVQLKKVSEEIQELLGKKSGNVFYGFDFDLLGGLTELTGGTKLSTVISVLQLADKSHKVIEDAKKFVPNLEKELDKIQGKIEVHVTDLATRLLKELGMNDVLAHGVAKDVEDLVEAVKEDAHKLILDLLLNMEKVFDSIKKEYPEAYEKVEHKIDNLREEAREIITSIAKHVENVFGYGLLDFAGDLTEGTSMGTALKVVSLVSKFNVVVQDVKNFEPKSEVFLKHTVDRVELSAQDFFKHVAQILEPSL